MSLDNYLKWFAAHERLMLVVFVVGLGAWGFNHWVDKSSDIANQKVVVAEQAAEAQKHAVEILTQQVAQQTEQFNREMTVRDAEVASLVNQIASRDAASNNQIIAVQKPKTPTQAVLDLQAAYPNLPAPVIVTDLGANVPTVDLQQFTVAKIEADTSKADLIDTKKELDLTTVGLASATNLVGALQNQVTGLQTEIKTNDAASRAEIASVKASARKSKWAWFKGGVVVGFVGGLFVGHAAGF